MKTIEQMRTLFCMAAPILSRHEGWSSQDLAGLGDVIAKAFKSNDAECIIYWGAFLDKRAGQAIAEQMQRHESEQVRIRELLVQEWDKDYRYARQHRRIAA